MAIRAIEICRVHRRNQGAYHPVYNSNGSKGFFGRSGTSSWRLKWYTADAKIPSSISNCFDFGTALTAGDISPFTVEGTVRTDGSIVSTGSGRPDGLFYDEINQADVLDLRNSSAKVEDYNRLIDREFNKLVAGTYRGSEGEWNIIKTKQTLGSGTWTRFGVAKVAVNGSPYELIGKSIYHNSQVRRIVSFNGSDTGNWYFDINSSLAVVLDADIFIPYQTTRTKSNTLTHTDIIGSPTNYPTAWKQSGVNGVPLIVAEDGTSLLPTGALTTFKLSRKANATPLQVLKSTDSGVTWTALTVTTHYTFSTITNAITMVTAPLSTDLIMVTYQTHTNMAAPAVNREVLAIGDVYESGAYHTYYGGHLIHALIGKIAVSDTISSQVISNGIVKVYMYQSNTRLLHTAGGLEPKSNPAALAALGATARAVKVFPYLTRFNGKAYLNLVFKEMKYGSYVAPTVVTTASATYTQYATYEINVPDSPLHGKVIQRTSTTTTSTVDWALYDVSPTGVIYLVSTGGAAGFSMYDGDSWGDDSKFNIVDYVSTTTDTNGATVLIGQKYCELPYFISAGE